MAVWESGTYNEVMAWEVEGTDQFVQWFSELSENQRASVTTIVDMLEEFGPILPHPYSSGVSGSRHGHMRELRIQSAGRPIRVFYAMDPRRT